MQGKNIVGRKLNIDKFDFYETPTWATDKAIKRMLNDNIISKDETIYECCSGAGAIVNILKDNGFKNIKASDIQDAPYIVGRKGIDVYRIKSNLFDTIITNPPYNLMTKENMLNEFLRIAKHKVILLLNIFYLSSKERKEMLENSHLKIVYIHSERVTMFPYGKEKPKSSGTKMYAWYVWDKQYDGEPIIRWL